MTDFPWYGYAIIGAVVLLLLTVAILAIIHNVKRHNAWKNLSPQEKEEQTKREEEALIEALGALSNLQQMALPSNAISENGVTVSYALDSLKAVTASSEEQFNMASLVEAKIRAILRDNRDADISKHEKALGIKVHSIERLTIKEPPAPPPPPPEPKGFYG
jgi:hypothetical protein